MPHLDQLGRIGASIEHVLVTDASVDRAAGFAVRVRGPGRRRGVHRPPAHPARRHQLDRHRAGLAGTATRPCSTSSGTSCRGASGRSRCTSVGSPSPASRGGGRRRRRHREPLAVLADARRALGAHYGETFDSIGFNCYRHGGDSVAWHGDRHRHTVTDPVVAIVSVGQPRPLRLRPRGGGRARGRSTSGTATCSSWAAPASTTGSTASRRSARPVRASRSRTATAPTAARRPRPESPGPTASEGFRRPTRSGNPPVTSNPPMGLRGACRCPGRRRWACRMRSSTQIRTVPTTLRRPATSAVARAHSV